jgi:hypothetical protein
MTGTPESAYYLFDDFPIYIHVLLDMLTSIIQVDGYISKPICPPVFANICTLIIYTKIVLLKTTALIAKTEQ